MCSIIFKIQIDFTIDANGILIVSAKDLDSGSSGEITISNNSDRLSPEEIENLIKDAELNHEKDRLLSLQRETLVRAFPCVTSMYQLMTMNLKKKKLLKFWYEYDIPCYPLLIKIIFTNQRLKFSRLSDNQTQQSNIDLICFKTYYIILLCSSTAL